MNKNAMDWTSVSQAQDGMLRAELAADGSSSYWVADYFDISGTIQADILEQAIGLVSEEMPALRTIFQVTETGFSQSFPATAGPTFEAFDLRQYADPVAEAQQRMAALQDSPGDLFEDGRVRMYLYRVDEERYFFFEMGHHAAFDGFGGGIATRRVAQVYSALARGEDYVPSHFDGPQEAMAAETAQRSGTEPQHEALRALADQALALSLGQGKSASSARSHRATLTMATPREFTAGIDGVRHAAASAAVAAVALYVAGKLGRNKITLILPTRRRSLSRQAPPLVTMATRLVPVHIEIDADLTVLDFVKRCNQAISDALPLSSGSMDVIRRNVFRLRPGDALLSPVVNVIRYYDEVHFAEHGSAHHNLGIGGVEDLNLTLIERVDGCELHLDANVGRYAEAETEAHLSAIAALIQKMCAEMDSTVKQVRAVITGPDPRNGNEDNDSVASKTLAESFGRQLGGRGRRQLRRPALEAPEGKLSYAELNSVANTLAESMAANGVVCGSAVAVTAHHGALFPVAALAAAKLGAMLVPVELPVPSERLRFILGDCLPSLVLVDSEEGMAAVREAVPESSSMMLFQTEDIFSAHSSQDDVTCSGPSPQSPAYLIYTSGSTGRPKGVVVSNFSAVELVESATAEIQAAATDRWSVLHSFGFDFSVWEMWGALLTGGTVVIPARDVARDPQAVLNFVVDRGITVLSQTPAALDRLTDDELDLMLGTGSVRAVVFGGDRLRQELVDRAQLTNGDVICLNMYGITEATVHATSFPVHTSDRRGGEYGVPIGRPLPTVQAVVLDGDLRPVPESVVGELFLSGVQLAEGYFGRPDLTAERFVADPAGGGGRLYRTGDLVRWSADGLLEYVGRNDFQVNVRGHRVELGEIEAALLRVEGVEQCVVVVPRDGESELVGYVVGDEGRIPGESDLLGAVRGALPAYMVPARVMVLDALPLTQNGKLDRGALPRPEARTASAGRAPRDGLERDLCGAFAEVLGVESVTIDDNFFDLGGDSLQAVRCVRRVEQHLGARVRVADVFECPSPAQLAARLRTRTTTDQVLPSGPRRGEADGLPRTLAPVQERIMLVDELSEAPEAYNVPVMMRVGRGTDLERLETAVEQVVRRHDAMHKPPAAEEQPDWSPFDWPMSHPHAVGSEEALEEILGTWAGTTFDLSSDVPLRIRSYSLPTGETVIGFLFHHTNMDERSLEILAGEIGGLYRNKGEAEHAHLPAPAYQDYSHWQRRLIGSMDNPSEIAAEQLDYWKRLLHDAPEELNLPTDFPRPSVASHRGQYVSLTVSPELSQKISEKCVALGVTRFTLFAAAVAIAMRHSGAGNDIPIGTPVGARNHDGLDAVVGFLSNTLVVRATMERDQTVRELVSALSDQVARLVDHSDVPFEWIVNEVVHERDTSKNPIFQVLAQTRAELAADLGEDGDAALAYVANGTAKFDLSFNLVHRHDLITRIDLEYATDLFGFTGAHRLAQRVRRALEAITDGHDARLNELKLASSEERHVIANLNRKDESATGWTNVWSMIEHRMERNPHAIALRHGSHDITYAELSGLVDRATANLLAAGVEKGDTVGLLARKSLDLYVTLLALVRIGACYLPIDPDYPAQRISHMLQDSSPALVVTDDSGARVLVETEAKCATVDVSPLARKTPENGLDHDSLPLPGPSDPICLMYTSGSTGRPKGAVSTHAGFVNRLAWQSTEWAVLGAADVRIAKTSLSYMPGSTELLSGLVDGATVVLVDDDVAQDPGQLADFIEAEHGTVVILVPSLLDALVEASPAGLSSVQYWIVGGDVLAARTVEKVKAAYPETNLINTYGNTEASANVAFANVTSPDRVTIGSAVPGAGLHVLDGDLRPVPESVVGELFLSGVQLAEGYFGRPDLTAERFVADPAGGGGRLYRTGDLVRWSADGLLEYVGRNDFQVNVRGHRVELGEIEAALLRVEGVEQCVVVVPRDGESELVGYVVGDEGRIPGESDLLGAVRGALPAYMVPARVMVLDALPLTQNGKLDRGALPRPEARTASAGRAPRDGLERDLCGAFAEVLGVESVTIDDNFFDLGGHSLTASRLLAKLRHGEGINLRIATLFTHPSVALLAEVIRRQTATARPALEAHENAARAEAGLSYAQRRLWFLDVFGGQTSFYNIPFVAEMDGEIDRAAFYAAAEDVVTRHQVLRTLIRNVDGSPRPIVLDPGLADVRNLIVFDETSSVDVTEFLMRPYALDREIPFRGVIQKRQDGYRILFSMHHVAGDGWSSAVIARDLGRAYGARLVGGVPGWGELPVQYVDYALWQRELLGGEGSPTSFFLSEVGFWEEYLRDCPSVCAPAAEFARPGVVDYAGGTVVRELDRGVVDGLTRVGGARGATLFMVLHALVSLVVWQRGGGSDVVVGTPVAGRSEAALEDLVGFFVNTLVLRAWVDAGAGFGEFLESVREGDVAAFDHQEVPFERLVEVLNPPRDTGRHPLFQVNVALQSNPDAEVVLGDRVARAVEFPLPVSKFDVTFDFDLRDDGRVVLRLNYGRALYSDVAAERLADQFERVAAAVCADASVRVGDLPALSEGDLAAYEGAVVAGELADRLEGVLGEGVRLLVCGADGRVLPRRCQGVLTVVPSGAVVREDGWVDVAVGDVRAVVSCGPVVLSDDGVVMPVVAEVPAGRDGVAERGAAGVRPGVGGVSVEEVCRLFEEVLEVSGVEADDNFFDRKGHSLLAVKLQGLLSARFSLQIDLKSFFKDATPRGVVANVTAVESRPKLTRRH